MRSGGNPWEGGEDLKKGKRGRTGGMTPQKKGGSDWKQDLGIGGNRWLVTTMTLGRGGGETEEGSGKSKGEEVNQGRRRHPP